MPQKAISFDPDNEFTPSSMSNGKNSHESRLEHESDVVDWDGPDDLDNPMNWSTPKKVLIIGLISGISFLMYVAH